ncbi:phage tail tube protein [Sphingobium sp. HT1-2]|uniref:phage tail tube protein n=1 Tax=Sphingobium sp. HT1-2 TaxID=3111640 RepID=UPI003BFB948B
MSFDASNISYYLIGEAVEGVTPTTGIAYKIAHIPGSGPTFEKTTVTSEAQHVNRQSGGVRTTGGQGGGSFDFELKRAPTTDLLLSSALSGEWAGNVLKAGATDKSFTILKSTGEAGVTEYHAYVGFQASDVSFTANANEIVGVTTNLIGMNYIDPVEFELPADITLVEDDGSFPLASTDIVASVALLPSIDVRTLTLTVSHDRQAKEALGPISTIGIGTSGVRTVTLDLEFYREDFNPERVFLNDASTSITVQIGEGANGYTITMPACQASWPEESVDGASVTVSVTFTAKIHADGDIRITRTA